MTPKEKKIHIARRALDVTPFLAMEVWERAKELEAAGREVIYLCLGEPDFPTPEPITKTAREAMLAGETRYTHSLGRIELREELAQHYRKRYGVHIDSEQVIISSGTSPLMLLLFATLCNAGDESLKLFIPGDKISFAGDFHQAGFIVFLSDIDRPFVGFSTGFFVCDGLTFFP